SRVGSAGRAWCTTSVGTPLARRLLEGRRDLRLVKPQPVICRTVAVRGHPLHDFDALVAVVDGLRHRDDGRRYADKNVAHAFTPRCARVLAPASRNCARS